MSEHILRLIREELQAVAVTQISHQKLSTVSSIISRLMSRLHELDDAGRKLAFATLGRIEQDVKVLASLRVLKTIAHSSVPQDSVDSDVLRILSSVLKAEEALLSPLVVKHGQKVAFLFSKDCTIRDKTYRRGDLAFITPLDLVLAYIGECGEALREVFYNYYRQRQS